MSIMFNHVIVSVFVFVSPAYEDMSNETVKIEVEKTTSYKHDKEMYIFRC